jgi:hypothetical protein
MQRHRVAHASRGSLRLEGADSLRQPHICQIVASKLIAAEPGSTIRLGHVKLAVQQD